MKRKGLVLVGACLLFSGCGGKAAETKTANLSQAKNAANALPSVAPNASPNNSPSIVPSVAPTATPDPSKVKTFRGVGVVTKINLELVSVELDHEEIKGLMPPMKMEFYVKEKAQLEALKIGDKVDFVLEDNAGAEIITGVKKRK